MKSKNVHITPDSHITALNNCHNDTTFAFMYGDADNRRSGRGITITFGYSKPYRVPVSN